MSDCTLKATKPTITAIQKWPPATEAQSLKSELANVSQLRYDISMLTQFILASLLLTTPDPPPLAFGTPAPHFVTKTLAGKPYDSKSLMGHVTVLDFWATWCVSCKEEMPSLQKLSDDYAKRGVQVIGMSGDTYTLNQVRPTLNQLHIKYLNTADPHICLKIEDAYNAEPLPSIYVIDRHGIVRFSQTGEIDDKTLRKILDSVLNKQ